MKILRRIKKALGQARKKGNEQSPIALRPEEVTDEYVNYRLRALHSFWKNDRVFARYELENLAKEIKKDKGLNTRQREKLVHQIEEYLAVLEKMKTLNNKDEKIYRFIFLKDKDLRRYRKRQRKKRQSTD